MLCASPKETVLPYTMGTRTLLNKIKNEAFDTMVRRCSGTTKSHTSSIKMEHRKKYFKFSDLSVSLLPEDQLKTKPKKDQIEFGANFTDHMFKSDYDYSAGWGNPRIIPFENLELHPASKVLHYALEVFEGFRAYRGIDGQLRLFRTDLNMERMQLGTKRATLPGFDGDELMQCIRRLIRVDERWIDSNEGSSIYIRPTIIATEAAIGLNFPEKALIYVIMCPEGNLVAEEILHLVADPNVLRAWPQWTGDLKIGSSYAATLIASMEAARKGVQPMWLYGDDRQVLEFGTRNVFVVRADDDGGKTIITPPLSELICPGITRSCAIELIKEWGLRLEERPITMGELVELAKVGRLLEVFGTGGGSASKVGSIQYEGERITIPLRMCISRDINRRLKDIQRGRTPSDWATLV